MKFLANGRPVVARFAFYFPFSICHFPFVILERFGTLPRPCRSCAPYGHRGRTRVSLAVLSVPEEIACACSSAGLERRSPEPKVAGSNPARRTIWEPITYEPV